MRTWIAVLVAAGVLAASGTPRAQVPRFRTAVDVVSFSVTVTDKKGNFVTDLKEPDFELYEDGVKQTLKYFAQGSAADADAVPLPLHVGVLVDISGSMENEMSLSRTAVIKFLKTLDDAQDMTVVDFDTEVRLARYTHNDFPSVVERIRSRKAEGNTAVYDALAVYLDGAASQDGRKVLVLYTDGGDNVSHVSYGDALTLLRASDVTVYSIGLVKDMGNAAGDMRIRLRGLADVAGGLAYFPNSIDDLDGVYEKIRDEIHSQYTLGYSSSNARQDGTWRKVEIKIVNPAKRDLKIRTRKGYFAPVKQAPR